MKIFKKLSSVCTALFCAAAVTVAGAGVVYAADGEDAALQDTMIATAEGLTETIVPLSDEEISNYMTSEDEFTQTAMTSWDTAKEELGEKTDEEAGETEVSYANKEYTVTVPVAFEKADANFVYLFDETGAPLSMSVDVQYPMSVTLQRAGLNTLMGIGTVFAMLIFLSFIIYLFKFIPGTAPKKKEEAPAAAPAPVAVPAAEETDDGELVAVIAAAIAAAEGTTTDGFVVRSIRKVKRNKR